MRRIKIPFLLLSIAVISYIFYFFLFTTLSAKEESQSLRHINKPYDLVIKHALILDGTGERERFRGDIAIREGLIVEVGSVQEQDFPVFDAGGLTVMPMPLQLINKEQEKVEGVLEHLFRTSFPRYPAHYLYFQDPPYQGFNLAQIAQQRGEIPRQTFNYLKSQLPSMTKVDLVPFALGDNTLHELAAYLTHYPVKAMGKGEMGIIKPEQKADLYFFITQDYDEESLIQLFLKGKLPEPALYCREGQLSEIMEP